MSSGRGCRNRRRRRESIRFFPAGADSNSAGHGQPASWRTRGGNRVSDLPRTRRHNTVEQGNGRRGRDYVTRLALGGRLGDVGDRPWQNRRARKSADGAGGWWWRSLAVGPHVGRLGVVGSPALSHRDGRDRRRDGGRPVRAGRPQPGAALGLEARLGRGRLRAGLCEQARGEIGRPRKRGRGSRPVPTFSQRAILARLHLFHDTGRLAAAEKLVIDAANDPRNDRTDLLVLLVPIYSQIGRSDEAERLIEDRWEHLNARGEATPEQSIKLVRVHIELTLKALSLENLRVYLDQVAGWHPTMTGSGWAEPTWRSRPAPTTRRSGGSTLAGASVRTMSRFGGPG